MSSMSCSTALDDSIEFSYGTQGVEQKEYAQLLDNEKKNFKLLINKVRVYYIQSKWQSNQFIEAILSPDHGSVLSQWK